MRAVTTRRRRRRRRPPARQRAGAKPSRQGRRQLSCSRACTSRSASLARRSRSRPGPTCKPDAPACEPGLYCLPVTASGYHCEPCPERDSIRHEFKDRDFVADQVARSVPVVHHRAEGARVGRPKQEIEGPCTRAEQFVASNYQYLDLRLVGIVAQGTQRKVLMMDRGNVGHIIRRGDCVGKEKAVVKDIGPATSRSSIAARRRRQDSEPRARGALGASCIRRGCRSRRSRRRCDRAAERADVAPPGAAPAPPPAPRRAPDAVRAAVDRKFVICARRRATIFFAARLPQANRIFAMQRRRLSAFCRSRNDHEPENTGSPQSP